MHTLMICTLITALLWLPLLAQAESFAVDGHSPISTSSTSTDPVADADVLFSYGEDTARDLQALATLTRALVTDAHNYQVLWRAARAYYQVGDDASDREKQRYFERGIEMGQRAVAQQPAGVEGHFWLAANYGGLSEIRGIWQAFQMVKRVRTEMETALRLQPDYEDGSAYRALGEIARQLPGVLGGNLQRAIAYFEQGLRVAPRTWDSSSLWLGRILRQVSARRASDCWQRFCRCPCALRALQADRHTQDKARQLLRK